MRVMLILCALVMVVGFGLAMFWQGKVTTSTPSVQLSPAQLHADVIVPDGVPPLPTSLKDKNMVVVWSAHAGARLEPCGCVAGMHGGLVRRASLVARLAAENKLWLECGGWSGGVADYQQLRAITYLRALRRTGDVIVGIGLAEVKLGSTILNKLLFGDDLPQVVSANVQRADGSPIGKKSVQVERAGRHYVVTSVAPMSATGVDLTVSDPEQALLKIIAQYPQSSIVVMADFNEEALLALARAVPGISLIVGGAVAGPSTQPISVGSTRIVHVANEGKTIGYWPWGADACHFDLVDDAIPDHPLVRDAIRDYQEQLGSMDLVIDERLTGMTTLHHDNAARYVGNMSCVTCHAAAHAVHVPSKHAHAYQSLVKKGYQHDPDCLRCHVVGVSLPDGFKRRGPPVEERDAIQRDLAQVGCESCHGRGSIHVAERTKGLISSGSLQPVTPATCQRCHDAENSPHFNYTTYWERIRHGR